VNKPAARTVKTAAPEKAKAAGNVVDLEMSTGVDSHMGLRLCLRAEFDTTLPRFDLMAQLERHPEGLKMNELSRRLMVTGGNVTGLTDQLEKEGFVVRDTDPNDRRSFAVRLTTHGRESFDRMARAHEQWVVELFGGLPLADKARMHQKLGKLKQHLRERTDS